MSEIISAKPNERKILRCSTWHEIFNCQQANPGMFCSFLEKLEKKYLYFTLAVPYFSRSVLEVHWMHGNYLAFRLVLFYKQEPNWLTSMVLTRKIFWVVHSAAFVAGSHQEMRLFQRCLFVDSSQIQYMLFSLSKLMMSISSVYWGFWNT